APDRLLKGRAGVRKVDILVGLSTIARPEQAGVGGDQDSAAVARINAQLAYPAGARGAAVGRRPREDRGCTPSPALVSTPDDAAILCRVERRAHADIQDVSSPGIDIEAPDRKVRDRFRDRLPARVVLKHVRTAPNSATLRRHKHDARV